MNNLQQKSKTVGRVSPAGVTRQTNGHDVGVKDNVGLRLSPNPTYGAGETGTGGYQDIPGYCRSDTLAEIAEHGHVLTPGRYVGAEAVEDDDEAFADKMQKLTEKLGEQMAKGAELDQLIRQKLGGLGYEF